jgi:diguanylate cyclase (GGDEF)-like protein
MAQAKKFLQLLKTETKYEDEPNSILFLARYLLLIYIPYNLLLFVYALCKGFFFYSLIFILSAVMHSVMFSLSYKIRPRVFAFFVCMTTIISACILTYGFGWRCSFQNHIYIIFLFIWYDAMLSIRNKYMLSVLITTIIGVLSVLTPFGGTILNPETIEYKLVVFFNILIFSLGLSIVAYIYCTQYVDIERNLRIYNKKLKLMSETDTLTKLMNRRFAEHELMTFDEKNNNGFISIALGDIDFFKNINDTYGHQVGDEIITGVADRLKNMENKNLKFGRLGGDEFCGILYVPTREASLERCKMIAEEMREKFNTSSGEMGITVSVGCAMFPSDSGDLDKVMEYADKALYETKERGRDGYTLFGGIDHAG